MPIYMGFPDRCWQQPYHQLSQNGNLLAQKVSVHLLDDVPTQCTLFSRQGVHFSRPLSPIPYHV
jgi:hypothetical protein